MVNAEQHSAVTVVVIGYNDASHIADAVRSALAQGPAVAEVLAVDDCSADGTGDLLDALAADEPRLRVLRRTSNSGGCGTPRNDGIAAARGPYLMFLDSDDVLPPGAVDALLAAAREHRADVAAGLAVRRELPEGRDTPWRPELYERTEVVARPADRPRLADDTLCVNKLYRTGFLRDHAIAFPDGRFVYEDFVFTARVLAAAPRLVLVPDQVYVWHVRRGAKRLSISLDRAGIDNWRSRIEAHSQVVAVHTEAGEPALVRAARASFLDRSVRMYVRELGGRSAQYRAEWWRLTRAYLASFEAGDIAAAPAPAAVVARVVLAAEAPRDLPRLAALAARPPRLLPPYATGADAAPVWSADLPQAGLGDLVTAPAGELPVAVEAALDPGPLRARLRLRLPDLYGRLAAAGPREIEVRWCDRTTGRPLRTATVALTARPDAWTAELPVDLAPLATGELAVRDLRATVVLAGGERIDTATQAAGALGRTAVPSRRGGVLLVQPYATADGALALRLAPGLSGALSVVRRRLGRR
ncbi:MULTISPECIES: glycosyltransferase family 2 protein [Streptomycetaceae]|uniref:Putative glycosyltransferase n=1 Tax=Streptantibioticus cattleyicolor (strain ATCC 35852 / DSM 46488 / JCM 4925 / NBRC 14057 / NRRL 8057) TaxID=1003195 RepID=F8JQC7_STREN|nr:glycosyltransferase family 2 protein [Streptantibioticus cattleyicolor]AEW96594.1 putative glycosyltransferase [Streptantibioticus cattleyicolor NRRL 8057 = DSM 46488]MYS61090.1 glycosyltransferase [Streptomyces sp. SID5468]CCB76931.1 putative glycosyltransferase, secreted [Streptantibioticus cattleyicolor NRRL 8057 = DSM 46488]